MLRDIPLRLFFRRELPFLLKLRLVGGALFGRHSIMICSPLQVRYRTSS
jgi:hypothetical protein